MVTPGMPPGRRDVRRPSPRDTPSWARPRRHSLAAAVVPAAAGDGAGGFDPHLSLIALDAGGRAAGLCRAAPEDGYARIDAPGVRPDLRATGLRAALLLGVCALARARGLAHVSVENWGDTPQELAADLALGLGVEIENPIYAAG